MAELIQKVNALIQDSDKVLIGIGEEFTSDKIKLSDSSIYKNYLEKKSNEKASDEVEWLVEYIRNFYINSEIDLECLDIFKAYKELFRMVKDKEYYVVNMNSDCLLEKAGFLSERIVYPCGNRKNYQCSNNCSNQVWQNVDVENNIIQEILAKDKKLSEILKPKCEICGEPVIYNLVGNPYYAESGYLDGWNKYTEWTTRTLNRSLCVIELGVSFKYPTVIRWPFEKIAFINNKAKFIRINEKFNQVSEELANKTVTIKENAIDFILK